MNQTAIDIAVKILNISVAFPFALQLWILFSCTKYKNAAMNLNSTNIEIYRAIKLRYTNCARLNIPLKDTESFVSKYFYSKGGPFRLYINMDRFNSVILCVTILTTTAMYCRGYSSFARITAISAASLCFYIFRSACSCEKIMNLTISFTRDYLENTLEHRLSPEIKRTSVRALASDANISANVPNFQTETPENKKQPTLVDKTASEIDYHILSEISENAANTEIIESVLQEYLA